MFRCRKGNISVPILAAALFDTVWGGGPIDPGVAKFDTCRRLCRKQPVAILEFWSTIWPALAACVLVFT